MKNSLLFVFVFGCLASFSALAEQVGTIEQVGNNSIKVDSGEAATVNAAPTPDLGVAPKAEKPDLSQKTPEDYQQKIIDDPQKTAYGRAQAAIKEENGAASSSSAPAKTKSKTDKEGKGRAPVTTAPSRSSDNGNNTEDKEQ